MPRNDMFWKNVLIPTWNSWITQSWYFGALNLMIALKWWKYWIFLLFFIRRVFIAMLGLLRRLSERNMSADSFSPLCRSVYFLDSITIWFMGMLLPNTWPWLGIQSFNLPPPLLFKIDCYRLCISVRNCENFTSCDRCIKKVDGCNGLNIVCITSDMSYPIQM